MSHPTSRPDPATRRDRARSQDAAGPVDDAGHPLEEAGIANDELRELEERFEGPPADEELAQQILEEERDEESAEEG